MKIVLIGAGAMGCLLHQQLQSRHQVQFLPKATTPLASLHQNYSFMDLHGSRKDLSLHYVQVEQLKQADVIICALKAYQMRPAVDYIQPYLHSDCPLILLHNGMGVLQQIRSVLAPDQLIGLMLSTQGARRHRPDFVQHTGQGQWQLGNYQNLTEQCPAIQLLIEDLGNCSWHDDIRTRQWTKLAINSVINPLTAIYDILNGELAKVQYQSRMAMLVDEIVAQADYAEITLDKEALTNTIEQVIRQTAQNSSSMREDILAGRCSEIDYINGYILQCSQQSKIEAPQNQLCVTQIKALEQQNKRA
ncbi:2-dehydropantoate 2-reductase [Thalassotalea litorea]|uniref:2-dehydropantoate 2-reductase n=1 Tax=Thalassotalea litorea TaxID=2020715 RepID=A0A5R9IQX7_9GAMM|nr:2-dehydropantoate 2-reductase [Thalassotalea litorea]TLU66883.1 2-dehydropantoate 2-reductase [Thalassotalea litorea]